MKKVIKKISVMAMAFTLLGIGTTVTNSSNGLTVKACEYINGRYHHEAVYRGGKGSEKIGNYIYCFRWCQCDCGYLFKEIEEIHRA